MRMTASFWSSNSKWLQRQSRDPYVKAAKLQGWRARSAFKLLEMNERRRLLRPGMAVVECGAAPGAWTQVACSQVLRGPPGGNGGVVIGCDLLDIEPVEGAQLIPFADFTEDATQTKILELLCGRRPDLVMSDMAPSACGSHSADHDAIMNLAYSALRFCLTNSAPGADFLCKMWSGARNDVFKSDLERFFKKVHVLKPRSSRGDSSEFFYLATQFKGVKK